MASACSSVQIVKFTAPAIILTVRPPAPPSGKLSASEIRSEIIECRLLEKYFQCDHFSTLL